MKGSRRSARREVTRARREGAAQRLGIGRPPPARCSSAQEGSASGVVAAERAGAMSGSMRAATRSPRAATVGVAARTATTCRHRCAQRLAHSASCWRSACGLGLRRRARGSQGEPRCIVRGRRLARRPPRHQPAKARARLAARQAAYRSRRRRGCGTPRAAARAARARHRGGDHQPGDGIDTELQEAWQPREEQRGKPARR